MDKQLSLEKFIKLKSKEFPNKNSDLIEELGLCTQSIYHWLQYCKYHYINLKDATRESNLFWDRISTQEGIQIRFVYEANITAFIHSLHALLDSFPYLLNKFITTNQDNKKIKIGWNDDFLKKYKDYCFYGELIDFYVDDNFNRIKGYTNTTKHNYIVRVLNKISHLEFDEYKYLKRYRGNNGEIDVNKEVVKNQNIILFIENCHNELIPKLFNLCNSILTFESYRQAQKIIGPDRRPSIACCDALAGVAVEKPQTVR